MELGADIGYRNKRGCTALHIAAAVGQEKVISRLLFLGLELEEADYSGATPLHWAAMQGQV